MEKGFFEFRTDAVGRLIADKMLVLTLEQLMEDAYGMGWVERGDFEQADRKEREGEHGTTFYLDRHIADILTGLRGERMASLDDVLMGLIRSYRNVLARRDHLYLPSYRDYSDQQPTITSLCSCGWAGPTYTMTRSSLETATALWHAHQTEVCFLAESQDDPHQQEKAEAHASHEEVVRPDGVNRYHRLRLMELFAYGESEFQVSCSCAWWSAIICGSHDEAINVWEQHRDHERRLNSLG